VEVLGFDAWTFSEVWSLKFGVFPKWSFPVVKCQPIHYSSAALRIKVAQFGLGPIGLETLKLASTKSWAEIVGGIDIDPAKAGKDLATLTGVKSLRGRIVYRSVEELLADAEPDLIFHTAGSKFKDAFP